MIHPSAINLFRQLDNNLSEEILDILDNKDIVYMFEFSKDIKSGVLYVYNNEELSVGENTINAQTDWFNEDKLWFRKSAVNKSGDKYEAFVSYLSDYRDSVVVNLRSPILCLKIILLETLTCAKPYQAHPTYIQAELLAA